MAVMQGLLQVEESEESNCMLDEQEELLYPRRDGEISVWGLKSEIDLRKQA